MQCIIIIWQENSGECGIAFPIGFLSEIRKINILLRSSKNKKSPEQFPARGWMWAGGWSWGSHNARVLQGSRVHKVRKPPGWGVCAGLPDNVPYHPRVPHTPAALLGHRGAAVYFFVLGKTRQAFNWISFVPGLLRLQRNGEERERDPDLPLGSGGLTPSDPPLSQPWHPGQGNILLRDGFPKAGSESLVTGAEMLSVCSTLCRTCTGGIVQKGNKYPGRAFPKQLGSLCYSSRETWLGERFESFRRVQQERLENRGNARRVSG